MEKEDVYSDELISELDEKFLILLSQISGYSIADGECTVGEIDSTYKEVKDVMKRLHKVAKEVRKQEKEEMKDNE